MTVASRYAVTETLYQDDRTTLYRAVRAADQRAVILKALDRGRSPPRSLERLRHEYEIGCTLDARAVVRPLAFETYDGMPALVLEDFRGQPLDRLGVPLPVETFLVVAERIAAAVEDIHRQGVVHKDLKPENILVDAATLDVKLADFGLATRVPREQQTARPPQLIEGSLPYLSPEQTGRMNRAVDSRSDLYALGVTFHQMLTGRLPFEARDPLEWVHCHVARAPTSPTRVAPHVPEVLGRIVLRLLAKMAEDRYQSAHGLRHDLERCLAQWRLYGRIEPFPLGLRDALDRLQVPQKLYGRDEESAALLGAFERVVATGAPELLLVSGAAGVGKSSLVHELLRPLARERGLFLEGKFDPHGCNVPYSNIVQAFTDAVSDILLEGEERRQHWQEAFRKALDPSARLVCDVIPSLKLLIGEPPPVPELPPSDAERRLHEVFREFVAAFTREGRPLILFLDDLQWADPGTLGLVEALVAGPPIHHLLLVGAYRDQEVPPSHPLALLVERIRTARAAVTRIGIPPLGTEHLVQLVAETLRTTSAEASPLSAVVYGKTGGNPFFVAQFLTSLYQERLLRFDEAERAWKWDLARIEEQGSTENVVAFLLRKLTVLDPATRSVLATAACIGHRTSLDVLAPALGRSEEETRTALWEAIREGLVIVVRDTYAFAHDRVQQAAYALIPEEQRTEAHLRIGRSLLEGIPAEHRDQRLFEIVTQLNLGSAVIHDPAERSRVAELNLAAGRRARAAAAHLSAIAYLSAGEALLPPESWQSLYDVTFGLRLERARCEWLCGNFGGAAELVSQLLVHARSRVDRAAAHRVAISLHTTLGQPEHATRTALEACSTLFGMDLELHPSEAALREAAEHTRRELGERSIEDLLQLPPMTDPDMRAAAALLSVSLPAAYFTDPNVHDLMCCRLVSLTLQHGTSDFSPHGFVTFGATLGRLFGRWEEAYRFGALACELVERRGLTEAEASTYFTVGMFINGWVRHVREVLPLFSRSLRSAIAHGDMNHACYSALAVVMFRFRMGDPLSEVAAEAERQLELTKRAKFEDIRLTVAAIHRAVQAIRGQRELDGWEAEVRPSVHNVSFHTFKALKHLLLGEHEEAFQASRRAEALVASSRGQIQEGEHCYVAALAAAAHLDRAPIDERPELLAAVRTCERRLFAWRQAGPANFGGRHALVAAELARLEGRDLEAIRLYEDAIALAAEHGFVHDEAMAHDLAAGFHRGRGLPTSAAAHLAEARACYACWGADAKIRELDRLHPQLAKDRPLAVTSSFTASSEQLDLLSVVKASQTISGEMVMERLIRTLLQVVLEAGGAQRGCLVLCREGRLFVEAEATLEGDLPRGTILESVPVESSPLVPQVLLAYVHRTGERLVLDDAAARLRFAGDAYLAQRRPRSIVCLPILRQGELVGLLYLENSLVSGAFTPDRLEALSLLASQAAISLQNALLLTREKAARSASEASERRAAFLADAGVLLSESLHHEETLVRLGQLCVRSLADWCVIDLIDGGIIRRVACVHADPTKEPLLDLLQRRYPASWDSPHPAARCLRTRQPLLLPETTDEMLRTFCVDGEHVEIIRSLGTRSVLVVPLVARGATLGALTLSSATAGRYGRADVELTNEVAHRAAIAIDNARLYSETQAAVRMRDEFLAVASHELRTPMTSLLLSLQSLGRDRPGQTSDPTMNRALARAALSGERLNRLILDLLDVSRIATGRLPLVLEDVELGAVVRDVVLRFEPDLTRACCSIALHGDAPVKGRWDRSRLDHVLTNLLSNAIKFAPGKPIDISLDEHAGWARLTVRDRGIGIDPAEHDRVFERFARAVSIQAYGGMGLGLYIARRIVQAHGGRILLVSEPGAGSTFTVELPCDSGVRDTVRVKGLNGS